MINRYSALHFNTAVRPITSQATTPQHTTKTNNQTINFGNSQNLSRRKFLKTFGLAALGSILPSVATGQVTNKEAFGPPPPIVKEIMKRPALMDLLIERAEEQKLLGIGYLPAHNLPRMGFNLPGNTRVGWFVSWNQVIEEYNDTYPNQKLQSFTNEERYKATEWIGLLCANDIIDQGIDLKRKVDKVPSNILIELNNFIKKGKSISTDIRDRLYNQLPEETRSEIEKYSSEIKQEILKRLRQSQFGNLASRVNPTQLANLINTINIEPQDFMVEFLRASTDCDLKKLKDISTQYVSKKNREAEQKFEVIDYNDLTKKQKKELKSAADHSGAYFQPNERHPKDTTLVLLANNTIVGFLDYNLRSQSYVEIEYLANLTVNYNTGEPLPDTKKIDKVGTSLVKHFVKNTPFTNTKTVILDAVKQPPYYNNQPITFWKNKGFELAPEKLNNEKYVTMTSTIGKIKEKLNVK